MLTKFLLKACPLTTLGVALALTSPIASAQDETSNISQAGAVEITADHADSTGDFVSVKVKYALDVRLIDGLTVHMDASVVPAGDPDQDATLSSEEAFIETLSLNYAGDGFTLYAGKLDPAFGSAFDIGPGIHGVTVGEAYQLAEKTGIGGDISLGGLFGLSGEHVLSAAAFTADRTLLASSLVGMRDRLRLEDGGISNTRGLKSYAVSLDGVFDGGLGYTLGYRKQAAGVTDAADEEMIVAGISQSAAEDGAPGLSWMVEVGQSTNADGVTDAKRTYYTLGGEQALGDDWFVNAEVSGWEENGAAGNLDQRRIEAAVGREITEGVRLEAGLGEFRNAGDSQAVFSVRLAWEFG